MRRTLPATKVRDRRVLRVTTATKALGRRNIPIDKKVFDFLVNLRTHYQTTRFGNQRFPWCGLLGADEYNCIRRVIKVYPSSGRGCWNMPDIETEVLADTAIKLATRGYVVAGLVRIGKFNLGNQSSRGDSLEAFGINAPGFYVVSLGLEGMNIETWNARQRRVVNHGWFTVKGGEYHGGEESGSRSEAEGSKAVRGADKGRVRKARGADRVHGPEQAHNPRGVSEPEGHAVHQRRSRQPAGRSEGLHPAEQGHDHADQQSTGRDQVARAQRATRRALRVVQETAQNFTGARRIQLTDEERRIMQRELAEARAAEQDRLVRERREASREAREAAERLEAVQRAEAARLAEQQDPAADSQSWDLFKDQVF